MMEPHIEALRPTLVAAAFRMSIPLEPSQADILLRYIALLQRWNSTYNLTSARDPARMVSHHAVDCLSVIQPLRIHIGERSPTRLLDVGSGAGLPGVVIAAMCPHVTVTCVDSVGKKAAFVRQVAAELQLPNLRSEHARVEQMDSALFDVVTCRAFASLGDLVSMTSRHLDVDGVWIAMKGHFPKTEIESLPSDIAVFHVEQPAVPEMIGARCLVWMRRGRGVDSRRIVSDPLAS